MSMAQKQRRYEALVQVYHKELYRFAFWLSKDSSVAEDLVQETFLRAWRSLDSLQDEKAAKSWLFTIVRRENARRFERKQFDYSDVEQDTIADTRSSTLDDNMEMTVIERHIMALPEEYREPLLLQVMGGFNGEEIASMLELNKNTVMTRLYRARNRLKEAINPSQEELKGTENG